MEFKIDPYIGVYPLEFGVSTEEVQETLNEKPTDIKPANEYGGARDDYSLLGVNYDFEGKASEFCFSTVAGLVLRFESHVLIGPGAINDPINLFYSLDPHPEDDYGFLVFRAIGINTTGYHDGDKSQRAINIFRRGFWDNG